MNAERIAEPGSASRRAGEDLTRTVAGKISEESHDGSATPIDKARFESIARAAYFRAERRGFEPGHELDDWLAAETEISEREGAGTVG